MDNRMDNKLTPERYKELFQGWFNNRMILLTMAIERPKAKTAEALLRMNFFLEDIEHHYIDSHAPKPVWDAFRYLRRFFKIYPRVEQKQSGRALEMIGRIYEAVGLEFRNGEKDFIGSGEKPPGRSGECVSRLDSAPPSRSPMTPKGLDWKIQCS